MLKSYSDTNAKKSKRQFQEISTNLFKTSSARGSQRKNSASSIKSINSEPNEAFSGDSPSQLSKKSSDNNLAVVKNPVSRGTCRARPGSHNNENTVLINSTGSTNESRTEEINNDCYFKSYARLSIHRDMLKDEIRTKTYRNVIYDNKHLFKGKIVLDVGCGTGILSLFAAKAGAATVIGIECSRIIEITKKVVEDNGFGDKILLVDKRVEDVIELPRGIEKVDIIISEWMGYCLFYESMLDTVLYARDKWLKKDGYLFPDKVSLYIAGMEDRFNRDARLAWWHDLYDYDFSALRKQVEKEAIVDHVPPNKLVTLDYCLKEFDLYTMKKEDVSFVVPFQLTSWFDESMHALVTYFNVYFTKCHTLQSFSTSMDYPSTHWKQTIFYLKSNITLKKNEKIYGQFSMTQNAENKRELDIKIKIDFEGHYSSVHDSQEFHLR
uniref:type I protein arginine methyltransferase n=1 Tax=Culicoides sonorensis TaxID=179676 RepID=A0A336LQ92_CULSO